VVLLAGDGEDVLALVPRCQHAKQADALKIFDCCESSAFQSNSPALR